MPGPLSSACHPLDARVRTLAAARGVWVAAQPGGSREAADRALRQAAVRRWHSTPVKNTDNCYYTQQHRVRGKIRIWKAIRVQQLLTSVMCRRIYLWTCTKIWYYADNIKMWWCFKVQTGTSCFLDFKSPSEISTDFGFRRVIFHLNHGRSSEKPRWVLLEPDRTKTVIS